MNLSSRDQALIWHPFTQMKTAAPPVAIVRGEGAQLYGENGERYLDAVSSWWVNVHGHSHPHIAAAIAKQAETLEHVIFAGFTHPKAVELAERLLPRLPGKPSRLFFSDNGSTAVEVALKMALQYHHNLGKPRHRILAFENAYHGDTFGAMSVSGRSAFTAAFSDLLFEVDFIPEPYPGNEEESWKTFEARLQSNEYAAFIFEPLLQGSAGMCLYSAAILDRMLKACREAQVLSIADEVFTGFGRTGRWFACNYLTHQPDIVCVSKGLTGGFLPLGLTACAEFIYRAFYDDDKQKALYHGHSYTGNPLSCAAACASLDLFEKEDTWLHIARICTQHEHFADSLRGHSAVREVRHLGTMLAIEVQAGDASSYFHSLRDEIYAYFMQKGLLMRPLGNVIYVLPPYCITEAELSEIYTAIRDFLLTR